MKLANLIFEPANKYIFRQGDDGDLMYIIVRGGCHVRIRRETMDGSFENPVVHTMYDGIQFGELALMQTSEKPKGLAATLMKQ